MGSICIYVGIYEALFDANKPQSQCNNGVYTQPAKNGKMRAKFMSFLYAEGLAVCMSKPYFESVYRKKASLMAEYVVK